MLLTKEKTVCCIHGVMCKKGVKEAENRTDVFSLPDFYIGALDRRQARRRCRERTSFRLFHELSHGGQLDNLEPELKLFIVYRTSSGKYCYFPILEQELELALHDRPTQCYYVDYGESDAPRFTTLVALVRYYTVYVQLHRNKKGEVDPDVFPYWKSAQE